MTVRNAASDDLAAVQAMLEGSALPHQDVPAHFANFIVARDGDRLLAVAGLEVHGPTGLLRSVCVDPSARGRGLGERVCAEMEARAAATGLADLYLLTTTAHGYFGRLGYRVVDRAQAPDAIRQTEQFRSLCPSSAVCMHKPLKRDAR